MNMQLPARLFQRKNNSHKGDYGHVLVLAGSKRYVGAAVLSAQAALRSGAGLVTLGIPESLYSVFAKKLIEVMILPLPSTKDGALSEKALKVVKAFTDKINCLLIGPGLSQDPSTQRLVRSIVRQVDKPMVVDADALNALAGYLNILKKYFKGIVMTPHPRELSRLINKKVELIQKDRKKVAKDFVLRYNSTLVLKGSNTVVVSSNGDIYVNRTGNPGMATAGAGDVLSGIIAAFLAQGLDTYSAAKLAVYVHGLAGDIAARDKTQVSLIASDIIEYLPKAFRKVRNTIRNRE